MIGWTFGAPAASAEVAPSAGTMLARNNRHETSTVDGERESAGMNAVFVRALWAVGLSFTAPVFAHHGAHRNTFTATGFAHQAERTAVVHTQVDPVQGLDHPFVGVEIGYEINDFNQLGHL